MTGERPGDPTGLAARTAGDGGDEPGVVNTSGVGVGWKLIEEASAGGAPPSTRTGVPPMTGAAPSRGRSGARLVQASGSTRHTNSARTRSRWGDNRLVSVTEALGPQTMPVPALGEGCRAEAAR